MIQRLLNLSLEQKNTTYIQTLQVSTVHCFVLQVIHIERQELQQKRGYKALKWLYGCRFLGFVWLGFKGLIN